MNPKTETGMEEAGKGGKLEFSPMFLRWIISLTIVTLLLAFFGKNLVTPSPQRHTPIPWTMAGGIIIQQGVELFSGKEPAPITTGDKWEILLGLLTAFVLAPSLLFFSWRTIAVKAKEAALSPATIGFGLGVVLMVMSALPTFSAAIIHPMVASQMREAQALGEDRDQVIRGLWRVSVDAYQYKILPKSLGGGEGSYLGYEVPASLRDFESNEYTAVSVSDTTFTLLGSSTQFPGAGVQGVYDGQGKLSGTFKFMGSYH